jgi:hypothetical protein
MGAFLVNVHVRTEDHDSLVRALKALPVDRCWATSTKDGWSTVYDERASTQDEELIRELTRSLSEKLAAPAIAFLVHDSDFLCYWLFDRGELLDEFNSCPDYFGEAEEEPGDRDGARTAGQPDVLLRFCRPGSRLRDIEQVLSLEPTFAESQLEGLAPLLGIEVERLMTDYRDFEAGDASEEFDAEFVGVGSPMETESSQGRAILRFPGGDLDDEDLLDDETAPPESIRGRNVARLQGLFRPSAPHDPLVAELVQAASEGNVTEIERLVAAGADIQGTAPLKLSTKGTPPFVARMLQGGGLSIPVSPLLAAVSNKRLDAARLLIELGADVNAQHAMFGSLVHGAASGGAPDLLRLLLDAGAGVNELNAQGQTPLQALRAVRSMTSQLGNLRSLGAALPAGFLTEFERLLPSAEGWDECERLLRERGGN